MIKKNNDIAKVKKQIASYLNEQVEVTLNLGRNKRQVFSGELSGIYPALFTVRPNDRSFLGKTAYSYSEILCGSVLIRPLEQKKAESF